MCGGRETARDRERERDRGYAGILYVWLCRCLRFVYGSMSLCYRSQIDGGLYSTGVPRKLLTELFFFLLVLEVDARSSLKISCFCHLKAFHWRMVALTVNKEINNAGWLSVTCIYRIEAWDWQLHTMFISVSPSLGT